MHTHTQTHTGTETKGKDVQQKTEQVSRFQHSAAELPTQQQVAHLQWELDFVVFTNCGTVFFLQVGDSSTDGNAVLMLGTDKN